MDTKHTYTIGEAGIEFRSRLPGVIGYRHSTIANRCRSGDIPATKIGKDWSILGEWVEQEINVRLLELDQLIRKKMIIIATDHPIVSKRKVNSKHWSEETVKTQVKLRILEGI